MHLHLWMHTYVSQESDEDSDESDDEYSQNGYSTGPGTMRQAASPADTQVPVLLLYMFNECSRCLYIYIARAHTHTHITA